MIRRPISPSISCKVVLLVFVLPFSGRIRTRTSFSCSRQTPVSHRSRDVVNRGVHYRIRNVSEASLVVPRRHLRPHLPHTTAWLVDGSHIELWPIESHL